MLEWLIWPYDIERRKSCPKCLPEYISKSMLSKSHNEYIMELHEINPDIEVLDTYINFKNKIKHKFRSCGHEILVSPENLKKQNYKCKICNRVRVGLKNKLSNEEYKEKIYKLYGNEITVLKEYNGYTNKIILHKHNICNREYIISPNQLLYNRNGVICNYCTKKKYTINEFTYYIQGYEDKCVKYLIDNDIPGDSIITNCEEAIPYVFNGKNRKYYPDIFVAGTNAYFEIKSEYTFGLGKKYYSEKPEVFLQNQTKSLATKALGFDHFLFLGFPQDKYSPIILPSNWDTMTIEEVKRIIDDHCINTIL